MVKLEKYFYTVIFEERTGKILLISKNSQYFAPGGEVLDSDLPERDRQGWRRKFCCRVVPEQTGLSFYYLEETIQDVPSSYDVYPNEKEEEYSAIIVGHIGAYRINQEKARFYSVNDVQKMAEEGKVNNIQQIIIYRAFVSRDCHNSDYNKEAVPLLKESLKRFL